MDELGESYKKKLGVGSWKDKNEEANCQMTIEIRILYDKQEDMVVWK